MHFWLFYTLFDDFSDRLLIYNVEDGWEPLARFLNMTPPHDKPFPRINDADTVRLVVKGGYWILVLVIPVIFCLCTCKIRRRLLERSLLKIMSLVKQAKDYFYGSKQYYSPVLQIEKDDDNLLKA